MNNRLSALDPVVDKSGWGLWSSYELLECYSFQTEIVGHFITSEHITLHYDGVINITPGYKFSASGPTWDTPSCRLGVLIHDSMYQLMEHGLTKCCRQHADRLLLDLLILKGMCKARAYRWYAAVRAFGWIHA